MDDNNFNNQEAQQPQEQQPQAQQPQMQQPQYVVKQKKPIYKRVWFWILIVVVVLILLIAISGSGDDSSSSSSTDTEVTAEATTESPYTVGDYEVYVVTAEVTENWDEEPAILITYSFTNNSDDAAAFDLSISDGVYQNGVELETTFNDDLDFGEDYSVDIQPGVTIELSVLYELRDTTTPVDVELSDMWDLSDDPETVTTTIDIA